MTVSQIIVSCVGQGKNFLGASCGDSRCGRIGFPVQFPPPSCPDDPGRHCRVGVLAGLWVASLDEANHTHDVHFTQAAIRWTSERFRSEYEEKVDCRSRKRAKRTSGGSAWRAYVREVTLGQRGLPDLKVVGQL